jgi:hypothetical protein
MILKTTAALALALAALCAGHGVAPALAGQTVTINDDANANVYGNGPGPGGTLRPGTDITALVRPDDNTLTINNSQVNGDASGGAFYSLGGSAAAGGNSLISNGGDIDGNVYGGYAAGFSGHSAASGNSVSFSGGSVTWDISGGYAGNINGSSAAAGNRVTVTNSSIGYRVYGGNALGLMGDFFTAIGNNVTVLDSSVADRVYGGRASSFAGSAVASGNSVSFTGSEAFAVFGGLADSNGGSAVTDGNRMSVVGSQVGEDVYGGNASGAVSAVATGNSVSITGSEVEGFAVSGLAHSAAGSAVGAGNRLSIRDSFVGFNVVGGSAEGYDLAAAEGNSADIAGGLVAGRVYGGMAHSSIGSAVSTGNRVNLSDTEVTGHVVGGEAENYGSGSAAATGNRVSLGGGSVGGNVYGGAAIDDMGSVTATGNSAEITGSEAGGNVYGGYAVSIFGSAAATGNSVAISGGSVADSVYGGYAASDMGAATAAGNTVTLSGNIAFGAASGLYGGVAVGLLTESGGNTLNLWNYSGSAVAGVRNFELYNFILPASLKGLEVTGDADFTGASVTGVSFVGGGYAPAPGDSFTLADVRGYVTGAITNDGESVQGRKGAALLYDDIVVRQTGTGVGQALTAAVGRAPTVNPQMKSLSEAFLSGLALLGQGADLAASHGLAGAVSAAANESGFGAFAALSGGRSRYNSGSHSDLSSLSLLTGLAWGTEAAPGRVTLGAFFEYGRGSYDSYNAFSNAASVDGSGDADYFGGGLLTRLDFAGGDSGHAYAEGSLRAGRLRNDYRAPALRDALGQSAAFDSSSGYYGLHLGGGYVFALGDQTSLDVYGKYFWTRQGGDSVTLPTGDPVSFDDAASHRLRLGSRLTFAANERVSPYAGLAYEHEFDGRARASTYGYAIAAPELRGGTGVGELGLSLKPSPALPLSVDLGVQGYLGQREGAAGSVQIRFEF